MDADRIIVMMMEKWTALTLTKICLKIMKSTAMFTIPRQTAEETLMKEVLPDARTKRTTRSKTQN